MTSQGLFLDRFLETFSLGLMAGFWTIVMSCNQDPIGASEMTSAIINLIKIGAETPSPSCYF